MPLLVPRPRQQKYSSHAVAFGLPLNEEEGHPVKRSPSFSCVILVLLCLAAKVAAQDTPQKSWLTGDAFQRQLESRVGIAWSSEPFRQKLNALSEHTQIAIWLDRRIDPSQQPEVSIPETELSRCFAQIAASVNAGVCYVGPVTYFGPRSVADKLATVAEIRRNDVAELPAEARDRISRTKALSWDSLTTPQELLEQQAKDGELIFTGLETIPHDLWAAGNFPPLSLIDRLTLILAGFDLTFEFDASGKELQLVPLPDRPTLVRRYSIRGDISQVLSKLQTAVPQASLKREGPNIVAIGRTEEHQQIALMLQGEKVRVPAVGQARTVYTMKGPSMLGTVLKTLQVQAGVNISLDAKAQEKLRDRINFEVKNAELEDLLTAVLRETGLKFQLNGKDLKVFAP